METETEILENLKKAVICADEELLQKAIDAAVRAGIDPIRSIRYGLMPAMQEVGEKMSRGQLFLSQVMLSATIFEKAAKELIAKLHPDRRLEVYPMGTVIIGTVHGDIHDIGKNMVSLMLSSAGFNVLDLGRDVPVEKFVESAVDTEARIIGLSALMTTTMPVMRDVIKALDELGLRKKCKVIIGGGPITEHYAEDIGADGYGRDMIEAVKVAMKLIEAEK
jgi:corrinoid protein of di/trimethylamine methyltransferase